MAATMGSVALSTAVPDVATFCTMTRLSTAKSSHCRDVVQAQVVTHTNVGDDCNLATVKCQTFAQHATARSLQNSGIYIRMGKNVTRAAWAAAITAVGLSAVDIHAIGVGHANA
jgi:hypothetical protein